MSNLSFLKKAVQIPLAEAWNGDKLERSKVAAYLTPVIASIRDPFVISLSSPYGTGKTFFIKHWQQQLNKEGYRAIYFNAWETDYAEDALVAFISSIKKQLEDKSAKPIKELKELTKKGGAYITRKILPIVIKGVARKVIGEDTVTEVLDLGNLSEDEITELFGNIAEDTLRKHEAVQASVEEYKKYLEAVVKKLTDKETDEGKKKLIVFVDELDRCRPTYAIEILECIKHLFSVSGMVFILAIDEAQLQNAVTSVYGGYSGGEGYLRKFIDWRIKLPDPPTERYAFYLEEHFGLKDVIVSDARLKDLVGGFALVASLFKLTLRQQEQCFTEINLAVRSKNVVHHLIQLLGPISALKMALPNEMEGYCLNGNATTSLLSKIRERVEASDAPELSEAWLVFEPFIHAAFMSVTEAKNHDHITRTAHEALNGMDAGGVRPESKAYQDQRKLWVKLDRILTLYKQMKEFCHSHKSCAEFLYRELEKASFII